MAKWSDPLQSMSVEELGRLAGGDVPQVPSGQSSMLQAIDLLQKKERPFSPGSEHAWKYQLGGEVARAGVEGLVHHPATKAALGKYGFALDAASNFFGANTSTDAGSDPYGETYYGPDGRLRKGNPTGISKKSMGINALESVASAAQWNPYTAIPAYFVGGEGTEGMIHDAAWNDVPKLTDIAFRRGQYEDVENAVRDLAMMNSAPPEPNKAAMWGDIRLTKKNLVDSQLQAVRKAIASKDKAQIDEAAKIIPHLAAYMDEFNADMELLQTSSQEYTWPISRAGEAIRDEVPSLLSPDRFIETLAGNINNYGVLDYFNPGGANMRHYRAKKDWEAAAQGKEPDKRRTQGRELLDEVHQRALGVAGKDTRVAREERRAKKEEIPVVDPYTLFN